MDQYVGLDVSLKETCVCVIDGEGNRVWQGKCSSSRTTSKKSSDGTLHARTGCFGNRPLMCVALARVAGVRCACRLHPCAPRQGCADDATQQD